VIHNASEAFMEMTNVYLQGYFLLLPTSGVRGGVVVEALRYKPEGRGFDSQWFYWIFFIDIILPVAI
jgi:hypothetical protein